MNGRTLLVCGTGALVAAGLLLPEPARAEGFTAHHSVAGAAYEALLTPAQKIELRRYLDYEHREPCQKYRKPPEGFAVVDCELVYIQAQRAEPSPTPAPRERAQESPLPLRPSIQHYKVLFDFDSERVRASEQTTLDRVASEISIIKPYEVTVTGHADRAGAQEYNLELSKRRAMAVSAELTRRGIPNRILGQEALGEAQPALPTPDGVPEQENRRVVIDFRK